MKDEIDTKDKISLLWKIINGNIDDKMGSLRELIKADEPVFIYGDVGTVNIQEKLFPDCLKIGPHDLNNQLNNYLMFLYGKNLFNLVNVKPYWLRELEAICHKYPDKIQILVIDDIHTFLDFFDIIDIACNKMVYGKWKLPKNSRVVTIGNKDIEQFNSPVEFFVQFNIKYTDLLEPLFTDSSEVLKSLQTKKIIHPFIITYVAYKGYDFNDGVVSLNNDFSVDSKWQIASDRLYNCCDINALDSLLGKDINKDFIDYCTQKVISVEKIINGEYTDEDIEFLSTKQKYLLIAILSSVNEEDLEKVRTFISKFGPAMLDLFDAVYSDNYRNVIETADYINNKQFDFVLDSFIRSEYHLDDGGELTSTEHPLEDMFSDTVSVDGQMHTSKK